MRNLIVKHAISDVEWYSMLYLKEKKNVNWRMCGLFCLYNYTRFSREITVLFKWKNIFSVS